jgi:hypothetical protein
MKKLNTKGLILTLADLFAKDGASKSAKDLIMCDLPKDLDFEKEILVIQSNFNNIDDQNILSRIDYDLLNIQYSIKETAIPEKLNIIQNGVSEVVTISSTADFNERMDYKDTLLLGSFYLLLLNIDYKKVFDIPEKMLFPFVNSLRNRPHGIYKDIFNVVNYGNLLPILDQFLLDNPDDQYHKSTDKIKIILNALSKKIKELPTTFSSEEEMILFTQNFIETDVEKRIGSQYFNGKKI